MPDACEFLDHRTVGDSDADDDEAEFDHERPYCTAIGEFVQPMRADICAKRYGLDPERDCEFYREAKGLKSITGFNGEEASTGVEERESEEVES